MDSRIQGCTMTVNGVVLRIDLPDTILLKHRDTLSVDFTMLQPGLGRFDVWMNPGGANLAVYQQFVQVPSAELV